MEELFIKEKYHIKKNELIYDYLIRIFNTSYTFPPTYYDEECNEVQCDDGVERSIDEIYWVVKTQLPDTTFKDFCKNLFRVLTYNTNTKLKNHRTIIFCPDIEKWVLHCWGLTFSHIPGYYFMNIVYNYASSVKKSGTYGNSDYNLIEILMNMEIPLYIIKKELKKANIEINLNSYESKESKKVEEEGRTSFDGVFSSK